MINLFLKWIAVVIGVKLYLLALKLKHIKGV